MRVPGSVHRWWYAKKNAKGDRICAERGHVDERIWSDAGGSGVHCRRCNRSIWHGRGNSEPITFRASTRVYASDLKGAGR